MEFIKSIDFKLTMWAAAHLRCIMMFCHCFSTSKKPKHGKCFRAASKAWHLYHVRKNSNAITMNVINDNKCIINNPIWEGLRRRSHKRLAKLFRQNLSMQLQCYMPQPSPFTSTLPCPQTLPFLVPFGVTLHEFLVKWQRSTLIYRPKKNKSMCWYSWYTLMSLWFRLIHFDTLLLLSYHFKRTSLARSFTIPSCSICSLAKT